MQFNHMHKYASQKDKPPKPVDQPKRVTRKPVSPEASPSFKDLKLMKEMCLMKRKDTWSIILGLGFIMALRRIEIANVLVDHIQLDEMKFVIQDYYAKGKSGGTVPILEKAFADELRAYIIKYDLNRYDYLVNHTPKKKPYSVRQIANIVEQIGSFAGFRHLRPHLLRHARAKWLIQKGKFTDKQVQFFLRHQLTATTTQMYNRFRDDEVMAMLHEGRKSNW